MDDDQIIKNVTNLASEMNVDTNLFALRIAKDNEPCVMLGNNGRHMIQIILLFDMS